MICRSCGKELQTNSLFDENICKLCYDKELAHRKRMGYEEPDDEIMRRVPKEFPQ